MEQINKELSTIKDWFAEIGITQIEYLALTRDSNGKVATARAIRESEAGVLAESRWDILLRPARGTHARVVMLDDLDAHGVAEVIQHWKSAVVETSAGNHQIWISANRGMDEHERLQVQRLLAQRFEADAGSVSGEHYGRAPGFSNRKPGRKDFIARVVHAAAYGRFLDVGGVLAQCPRTAASTQRFSQHSHASIKSPARSTGRSGDASADEFGWVIGMLISGMPVSVVTDRLICECSQRRGGDAHRYATRTVKKALEALESSR